jgi:hypothetical protein
VIRHVYRAIAQLVVSHLQKFVARNLGAREACACTAVIHIFDEGIGRFHIIALPNSGPAMLGSLTERRALTLSGGQHGVMQCS